MKETVINAFADKAVLERLFTNGPGELLAVNSKAGYLKAGQDVYMLCSADLGITPIGIAVAVLFLGIFLYTIKKRHTQPHYETLGK